MAKKHLLFMCASLVVGAIILGTYFFEILPSVRYQHFSPQLKKLSRSADMVTTIKTDNSQEQISRESASKLLLKVISNYNKKYAANLSTLTDIISHRKYEVADNSVRKNHYDPLKERKRKKFVKWNPAAFLKYMYLSNLYRGKETALPYTRYMTLKNIKFAVGNADKFTAEQNLLFSKQTLSSLWMKMFLPPSVQPISSYVCNGSAPFLLIIVPSVPSNRMLRMTIRQTWGSVSRTQIWPYSQINAKVQVLFVMGSEDISPSIAKVVDEEKILHNDILVVNMEEDYNKLTMKMLAILQWVNKNCSGVQFILKADEDSFVNVPLLVDFLLVNNKKLSHSVLGHMYTSPNVRRNGKWKLSYNEYPLSYFPTYSSGSAYIISGDAIGPLLKASHSFIPIPIEDAYITGILAKSAGVTRYNTTSMAMMGAKWFKIPRMCEFFRSYLSYTDCTAEIFDRMWLAVEICYCGTIDRSGLDIIGYLNSFKD